VANNYLIVCATSIGQAIAKNTTRYMHPLGLLTPDAAATALTWWIVRDTLTASNLWVRISANTVTGNSVFTFKIGATSATQTITVGSTLTGAFQDTTHTDSLVSGNGVSHKLAVPNLGTSITVTIIAFQIQADSAQAGVVGSAGPTVEAAGFVDYYPMLGYAPNPGVSIEARTALKVEVAGTLSNMALFVYENTRAATGSLKSRVNGSNGAQTVTITGSTTGLFEDTTNTDAVSIGQTIGAMLTAPTGAGNFYIGDIHTMKFASAGQIIGACDPRASAEEQAAGTTGYCGFGDYVFIYSTTPELNVKTKALFDFTLKNLCVYILTCTLNVAGTIGLRLNGVTQALVVSANATGILEDTTHTVDVVSTDLINTILDASAAASGVMDASFVTYELDQPSEESIMPLSGNSLRAVSSGII